MTRSPAPVCGWVRRSSVGSTAGDASPAPVWCLCGGWPHRYAFPTIRAANMTFTLDFYTNGNLTTTNGQPTHIYDRANRLLSMGGVDYAYNGQGQRVGQTVAT